MLSQSLHLNVQVISTLVGVVIPLLTALVTKDKAPEWLKAAINAVLAAATGILTTAIAAKGNLPLGTSVLTVAEAFVVSIASSFGLWQPTNVIATINRLTGNFGLGFTPKSTPTPAPAPAPAKEA